MKFGYRLEAGSHRRKVPMEPLLSSKVTVIEEPPQIRGIPAAATSVAGAVGLTERGPIGKAVLVTSFEEFQETFGGFTPEADLALAAMGFFQNAGSQLWVVRTVHYADVTDSSTATCARAFGEVMATPDEGEPSAVLRVEGKDPGTYGNAITLEIRPSLLEANTFDLVVMQAGVQREVFSSLSIDQRAERFVERVIGDRLAGSRLIRVSAAGTGMQPIPDPQTVQLSGGNDGLAGLTDIDFIGAEAGKTGLHALDHVQDLSLLLVPGRATPAVHQAMIRYCEVVRKGTVFAILDPPAATSAQEMVAYVQGPARLLGISEFGAIFWPRVQVLNPSTAVFGQGGTVTAPPSGIIAGVFARTDSAHPGGVYDPPAGIEKGRMFGVLGFETDEVLEEVKRDLVYPKRINPLTTGPGLPRFIDGSRTLKAGGNFPYVAERRGVIFIERSLRQGLQFARHRNNTEQLRAQVRRTIASFLLSQMNSGAFRSREPDKAFFVDVSGQLNPPSVVNSGQLIVRVGLATNKPAEFIVLRISADTRGQAAELAQAGL
jgi:phage tail sheath protein FI